MSRRSILELLACVALAAVLATSPALGGNEGRGERGPAAASAGHGKDGPRGQGHGQGQGQGQGHGHAHGHDGEHADEQPAPAAAAAEAPAPPAAAAPAAAGPSRGAQAARSGPGNDGRARAGNTAPARARDSARARARNSARARARNAARPRGAQTAGGRSRGAGTHGGQAHPDSVPPATRPPIAPPETARPSGAPLPPPAPREDEPDDDAGERSDTAAAAPTSQPAPDAGAPAPLAGNERDPTSSAARPGQPAAETPALAQPPAGAAGVLGPVAPVPVDTSEGPTVVLPRPLAPGSPSAGPAAAQATPQGGPVLGPVPAGAAPGAVAPQGGPAAGGAPPATATLDASLRTVATDAITRVRAGAGQRSSGPRPSAGDTIPTLRGVDSAGPPSRVTRVLVWWAQAALGVLSLLVLALGANAIVAAARTRHLERQRAKLRDDVGLLQAALLPAVPARIGALLTTVAYRPAEGPAAGGDFYDAFPLPDGRVGLLLGDVSGHGRQALAKTTLVRFTVRAHLEAGLSPREAIAISGRSLEGGLADDFATVIAAVHDPAEGTLTYASAGHPPPLVVGRAVRQPVTASSSPPIGVGFPTGHRQTILPMPAGTVVLFHSDGLLEARIDGEPLGSERLARWLAAAGPDATARSLLDRVVAEADRVPDDLAAIVLHAAPGATAPAAHVEQLKLDVLDVDGPDLDGFLAAAGIDARQRQAAERRVSELLATTSAVVVEVRLGEHPRVSVDALGEAPAARRGARVR